MPGHEDPEGEVLYDERGQAYLKIKRSVSANEARLAEIKADLEDDGKLNYSNNAKKKSPGRKKKK